MKRTSKIAAIGRGAVYTLVALLLASGLAMDWEGARAIHGALAMLALLGLGALAGHVATGWADGRNRAAGILLLSALGGLAVSAWLLYYASPGAVHDAASRAHTWLGYALAPLLAGHIAVGRASARKVRPK